ncbi:hypothetical protein F7725_006524 [Dissostichus mawsoni]|uniref:Clathrin adaptor alpha/beta/gamma-adaptin appendage Ig-like subdomain domain-containing protein n=1 Tax=Dissostichus mawsoni TaxID=36200 RepID=A0A7J5XU75_DISMA|nr:hypothetical protein F7725_006524 [Dissostichus mawsoni]
MADSWNTDTGEAVYRSRDAVKNLKIRVRIERVTSTAALSQHLQQHVLSQQDGGAIELETLTPQGQKGDNDEELVVGWQEKLFSQYEMELFQNESACQTPLDRQYLTDIRALNKAKGRRNHRIFTNTDHDRFTSCLPIQQLQHPTDLLTTTKSGPTFLAERMASVRNRRQERRTLDSSIPKSKIVIWEPTEEFVKNSHVVNNAMQTMHIMADLAPPGRLGQKENEYLLLTIKTDGSGTVIVKPDFNKGKEPYRQDCNSRGEERSLASYCGECVHSDATGGEGEGAEHLYVRHKEYLNSLVGQDFEMPPLGILRYMMNGEIVSAKGFEYDHLYIHFFMELPNNWSSLPFQSHSGVTQTCRAKTLGKETKVSSVTVSLLMFVKPQYSLCQQENVAFFSYPFSFEAFYMSEKESEEPILQWPVIYFKVLSLDSWQRYRTEGYGYLLFPAMPGKHTITCHTWRPLQTGTVSSLRRFFIGGSPELEDPSYVRIPGTFKGERLSRFGFCTETTGSVTFNLHCLQQARAFVDATVMKKRRQKVLEQLGGFKAFQRARKKMQDAREGLPRDLVNTTSQQHIPVTVNAPSQSRFSIFLQPGKGPTCVLHPPFERTTIMTDSKYFKQTKSVLYLTGEIFELKAELNNEKKEKRKEAVKKVIAAMTVGKDVSSLFPDVVNCMQTDNLELKKLVYLYLMNYAKSQPDMAIMAVNSFVKAGPTYLDCEDPNPLIRALAVRTMGCIRVDKITEYLCEPLRKCLKDEDPYVRKTAAVCVAKLHDINAQMVEDQGFLDSLRDLIADSNPMISESHPNSNLLDLNPQNINKLLTALNECTEWGQIFILDCLSNYNPKDEREAQSICERVTPRLSHANSAVVLSAVKVLMKFLELLPKDSDYYNTLLKKLSPPLVTLLSGEPEVQYVALRNINLIVQKRPEILKQEIKVFFVKYNDPIYVKLEKLDIMIRLASQANIAQVLAELKEYATEVDVDFVRKAVRAIGRCAIKVEQSAERCVSTLLDLIQTKVTTWSRRPSWSSGTSSASTPTSRYESIIATLCENLDSLDEPDARAAMIWIVGEYAERIDNADELLESFLEGFHDESTQVQLTLLTAIVKLFLKKPSETQELVQQVLSLATQDSDNPDLRDRGYIYWRLLSTDPVTAKEVVLSEKPLISEETDLIEPTLLDELICHIGSLASVYHKPPSAFRGPAAAMEQPSVIPSQGDLLGDLLNLDLGPPVNVPQVSSMQMGAVDLLGGGLDSLVGQNFIPSSVPSTFAPSPTPAPQAVSSGLNDLFELSTGMANTTGGFISPKVGLEISGTFSRRQGHMYMDMTFTNKALQHMTDFAVQFNKNSPLPVHTPLMPSQTIEVSLPINTIGPVMKMDPLNNLQVAVKNSIDVFYFSRQVFLATWKDIPNENELQYQIKECHLNADSVSGKLQNNKSSPSPRET